MQPCSLSEIASDFDKAIEKVAKTLQIDPICSRTEWIIPAANTFSFNSEPFVLKDPNGYAALRRLDTAHGRLLFGFDAAWGFACPIVTWTPDAFINNFFNYLRDSDFDTLLISGVDADSELFGLLDQLCPSGSLDQTRRCVADLTSGFDGWLSNRSPRFRRSLRQAVNNAQRCGITLESAAPTNSDELAEVLDRIFAVEQQSWKTAQDSGLIDTPLGSFTRAMCLRFGRKQNVRAQFARIDGTDIGYVVGARIADRYRGFQHSYDQRYKSHSIGKVLQYFAIETLAAEGVKYYDLGMYMDYKNSYTDVIEESETLYFSKSRIQQLAAEPALQRPL